MSDVKVPAVGSQWRHRDGEVVKVTGVDLGCPHPIVVRNPKVNRLINYTLSYFLEWHTLPAPPESRWLDPASVPHGEAMPVCGQDDGCPFPGYQPGGEDGRPLCRYCKATECDDNARPRVPTPSVLTPAPRWRMLPKWSVLYPHPPRVRDSNHTAYADGRFVSLFLWRDSKTPRVRKVRDSGLMARRWTVA